MGMISSAMRALFSGGARAAGKDAAEAGESVGKAFIKGVVAQVGRASIDIVATSIKNKMTEGSKAAAKMGSVSKDASKQTAAAMKAAADSAAETRTKIVNITNNIYNMKNAYLVAADAAQQANGIINNSGTGAASGNMQKLSAAYTNTTGAMQEAAANASATADTFDRSQQQIQESGKATPGIIRKGWTGLRKFWQDLWQGIGDIAQSGLERIKSGWETARNVVNAISGAMKSALNTTAGALSGLAGYMDVLRGKAFWIAAAITVAFTAAVMGASKADVYMRKFNIVFGESAESVRQWAKEFEHAGLGEFSDTIRQLAQFQDTLKPMGMAREAAGQLSKQIVVLGTDLAAFNGIDTADAYRDLLAALTGSGEVMKKYGVVLTETALKERLLADGLDPDNVTNAEKAYARFKIILDGSSDAIGFASKSANEYDGVMRALRGELSGLSQDLGHLLKAGYAKVAQVTLGIVRAVREWMRENRILANTLAQIADWATLLPKILTGIGIAVSSAAAGFTLLAGAAGFLLSPLGLVVFAIAEITGAADRMKEAYYTAFDGAIAKTVEFALNSRVMGVSIRDWFTVGALAVQFAWSSSLSYIMGKMADFTGVVAGAYESLLQFQIGGLNIGNWIAAGIAIAKRAFYELKAVAIDAALAVSEIWVDGKVAMLDFWTVTVDHLQSISISINNIYYDVKKTWARIKSLKNPFSFVMDVEGERIERERDESNAKIRDALNPEKAKREADKARAASVTEKAGLQKELDSTESKGKAAAAKQEVDDILSGKKDVTSEYIAAEQGITAAVTAEMQKRQQAFADQAAKIRQEIDSIRQDGQNNQLAQGASTAYKGITALAGGYSGLMSDALRSIGEGATIKADELRNSGADIDQSLARAKNYILELGKNNPFSESFDKIKNLVAAGAEATGKEAKATAEGSFKASEIANGEKVDPLQDRIAQAVETSAKTSRDISSGINDLNEKFSVAR